MNNLIWKNIGIEETSNILKNDSSYLLIHNQAIDFNSALIYTYEVDNKLVYE